MTNIFNIPPEWRGVKPGNQPKKEKDEDLRAEIQRLIARINELKHEVKEFVDKKGKKASKMYPMLIEDLNDAARELSDVLSTLNMLIV